MSRDCVNLGPPATDEEIIYYNCALEDQGMFNMAQWLALQWKCRINCTQSVVFYHYSNTVKPKKPT